MRIKLKILMFCLAVLVFNCKKENKTQITEVNNNTEIAQLSEKEKTKIVTYYLINGRQLAEKDFHKIIFLNDEFETVKIIHYKGRSAFFRFKFSEALKFYNANK